MSTGPSGLSRYVDTILSAIDPGEFEVVLFCRTGGPYRPGPGLRLCHLDAADRPNADAADNVRKPHSTSPRTLARRLWRRLAPTALTLWAGFARDSFALARVFRQWRLDLLYTHVVGSEPAAVAARLAGIPQVLGTFHIDSSQSKARDWVLEFVTNRCLHRAIAVSDSTRLDWVRRTYLARNRVTTIPNGVDSERFRRHAQKAEARRTLGLPGGDTLVLGCTGRLSPQKGLSYLLRAVAQLASRYPMLHVALAGDGPLAQALREEALALGIKERVHFLGFRSDVQPVLDAADVFVLPSLWEALPYSLLEAMAAELPVVATRVAGVPEVVAEGETGLLVSPADPQALAGALEQLLDSPTLRRRMGQEGRRRVINHFDERTMVRNSLRVCREMLGNVPRRP
jgi:glycosyltransferase involved in cell wall biosynthesis